MVTLKREIKYLPVFFLLTSIYFSGVFLKGTVLVVGDGFAEFYPLMRVVSSQYKNFTFPFWNPYMYSGFPLFGSMQAGVLYPPNIVLPLLFSPDLAFNLNMMLHYSLAGFFTFLYARQIGLGVFPALISGTVFSLLGYLPRFLIHPAEIASAVWIPLILFFLERIRQDMGFKNALFASLAVAMQVFAGHPQICFFTYLLVVFYIIFFIVRPIPSTKTRFAFLSILSLAVGWMIALPQIVATGQLAAMAARAKTTYAFFSSYAFPLHMITSFLFPFFYYFGGHGGHYWGPQPDLGVQAFVGTLPFLLAVVTITRWKKSPHILFWGIVAVLAFVLSLGDAVRPLNKLLFELPAYNSFRGPSKHILEVSFALSVLAGFGISYFQNGEKDKRFRIELVTVLAVVIVISLVAFTFYGTAVRDLLASYFSHMKNLQLRWVGRSIPEGALNITDPAVYVPILAMSAYLVCLIVFMKAGKRYLKAACLAAIFVILFAEALNYKLGGVPDADTLHYNNGLYKTLASFERPHDGRTIFLKFHMALLLGMPYGMRLSGGYDPLEIGDYKKVLPTMYTQNPRIWHNVIENNSIISMMNVRYLVVDNRLGDPGKIRWYRVKDSEGRQSPEPPFAKVPPRTKLLPVYRKITSLRDFSLYENMIALPRAHAALKLGPLYKVQDLSRMLFSYKLDPWHEAVVSPRDIREIGSTDFSPGDVSIVENKPDEVTLSTSFRGRGFVVLADQFYPGWKAYIDGKRTKIYKTNGVQRGVVVPAGRHMIVFKYAPLLIYACMGASGLLFAGVLIALARRRKSSAVLP